MGKVSPLPEASAINAAVAPAAVLEIEHASR